MALLFSIPNSQIRAGGPRYVRFNPELDGGFDSTIDSGFGGGFDLPGTTQPPPQSQLPTPITNAEELAGGLTPAQIDQAAQMELEEGVPIPFHYGERLLAGTLVSHKYVTGPPKQNTFTVVLGEGQGGLGRHGEWEGIFKAWYRPGAG